MPNYIIYFNVFISGSTLKNTFFYLISLFFNTFLYSLIKISWFVPQTLDKFLIFDEKLELARTWGETTLFIPFDEQILLSDSFRTG